MGTSSLYLVKYMTEKKDNTTYTGKGFAKVQFLSISKEVKSYLEKDYPIKFLYNKYFNDNKFTYSYPHFITLIKRYIGKSYCKNPAADKDLLRCFAKIEEAVTTNQISKEYIINILTIENNVNTEFPEVCKILSKVLNNSKDGFPWPAVQKHNSPPAEQSSAPFGKRPAGAKPKI